jgi:hypothetical protein
MVFQHVYRAGTLRFHFWGLALVALVLGVFLLDRLPIQGGDTPPLAESSRALVGCVKAGVWSNCRGVDRFGLQQHLVGMLFAWKGFDDKGIVTSLALVNLVVSVVLVVLLMNSTTVTRSGRRLALLALLLGPSLAYSISSFGEALSVAVDCALVLALARRSRPWLVAVLAAYACTSRETAVFSVLLIGAAVLVARETRNSDGFERGAEVDALHRRPWWTVDRPAALGLLLGCISGVGLNVLFNLWRYGEIGNRVYDNPIFRTPGWGLKFKAAAAVWVSPGGGAFTYWFLGALLAVGVPLVALLSRDRRRIAAGILILLGLAIQTAVLSAWWAPFGWYAWGPRLLLPTLAMTLVAVAAVFHRELLAASGWLRQHPWSIVVLVGLSLVSAAANLGFLIDPAGTMQWFYMPHTAACPRFPDFLAARSHYYDCAHGVMTWRIRGSLWTFGAKLIWSRDGLLLMGCALIVVAALLDLAPPRQAAIPPARVHAKRS